MIIGQYEKFCKNFHLCEGYEKALNSSEDYYLHHIQGEYVSKEELEEYDWYHDCHPSCLKWVTNSEHRKIHNNCMRFESRKKMSESKKGEKNPQFGTPISDETKRKISESLKCENHPSFGKTRSAETRKKISEANKGRVHSDESRKNMSESSKGRVFSAETRKKISESQKGEKSSFFGKTWKLINGKRVWLSKEL